MECPLSDREREAVRLLSEGLTYKQMALQLGLSVSTVRTHLHTTFKKLGVVDRAQAVVECVRHGWIQLDPEREPQPGDVGRCSICGNEFPTETGRCAACETEYEDQLARMGVMKPDDWQAFAQRYAALMQSPVLHLRDEIVQAGVEAARLPYDAGARDLVALIKRLKAGEDREVLLAIAAVAMRWARRLERPDEEPDLSVEFDSDRVAEAIVQRHAAA